MKKKFYLTVMLLLSMAVGTTYADDDPSVVTLFEYSFADGMGEFTSVSSLGSSGVSNTAWHYNDELHCAEYSGTESGVLVSPLITDFADKKYYDIKLIFDYAGENINTYEFSLKLGNTSWTSYGETYNLWMPTSKDDFYTNRSVELSQYCHGKESRFAFQINNEYAADDKCYRVKNIKVTARDWSLAEGIQKISDLKSACSLANNTPIIMTLNNTKVSWDDNQNFYLTDGSYSVLFKRYGISSISSGDKITGELYGYITKNEGFTFITNFSLHPSTINIGERYSGNSKPELINFDDVNINIGKYIKTQIPSTIKLCTHFDESIYSKEYTPIYPTYFTGIPLNNDDGEIYFRPMFQEDVEIVLSDDMEQTPEFTENESGFTLRIGREFEYDRWYSICLPFNIYATSTKTIARLTSSEDGNLNFTTLGSYETLGQGEPALIKFNDNGEGINLGGTIYSTSYQPKTITAGDYKMVGTLSRVTPNSGCYYLTAGNTIRPLATGGKINAFRAYFEPNTPSAARTRSIVVDGTTIATGDGTTTDIEDILNGRTNGNGEVYNLNGQRVNGNSSQKGIYIINGKKVIK